jgi:hypothetical protein
VVRDEPFDVSGHVRRHLDGLSLHLLDERCGVRGLELPTDTGCSLDAQFGRLGRVPVRFHDRVRL